MNLSDNDITTYSWDSLAGSYVPSRDQPRRSKRSQQFLKGPVPMPWLDRAANLPGKALAVGLAIWRLSGAMKSPTVRLSNTEVKYLGVDRFAKARALRLLQEAGLLAVQQKRGQLPLVTLLNVSG